MATIYLRSQQTTPLSYNQMDSNFSTLQNEILTVQQQISMITYQGGTTAQRPTAITLPAVQLYQPYFDTTIGQPIFCSQISPSILWVNSAGVNV